MSLIKQKVFFQQKLTEHNDYSFFYCILKGKYILSFLSTFLNPE